MERVILIDGHYMVHRMLRSKNSNLEYNGIATSGVYGFYKSMTSVLHKYPASKIIVAWDGQRSKRRMSIYPEYKGNRGGDDVLILGAGPSIREVSYSDTFQSSKVLVELLLKSLGVHTITIPYEADDVIARMARILCKDYNVLLVTDDKDYYQIVDNNISLYRPVKDVYINLESFELMTGYISPLMYMASHAILGDGSDNISGILSGWGYKTVMDLLTECFNTNVYTFDNLPTLIDDIRGLCNNSKSKRLSKINEDYDKVKELFNRNLSLVNMYAEEFDEDSIEKINTILNIKSKPVIDEGSLVEYFRYLGFTSILENWTYNVSPYNYLTS